MSVKMIPICDRCHKGFDGPVSIITVYGGDGIHGAIHGSMEGMPLVYGLHICPACRAEIDRAIKGARTGAGAVPRATQEPSMMMRGGYDG